MENAEKSKTGFDRLWHAVCYSISGMKIAYENEAAFRQELILAAFLIPLGFYLGENGIARALLISSVILVLIVELLNSSIENTVDHISLEKHLLAERAKDLASAAVFISLIMLVTIWALVLS